MLPLALVPTAGLTGKGVAVADWSVGARGLGRLGIEIALVLGASAIVLTWKLHRVHQRPAVAA